tara:strand:- start:4834 stop:6180 length:1347 start_codon:yes stop_codon:yes gene_type:complete
MIIETLKDFSHICDKLQDNDSIVIPVLSDITKHSLNNRIHLIYVYTISDSKDYIIPFTGEDSLLNFDINLFNLSGSAKTYVFDSKIIYNLFQCKNIKDVNLINYFVNNSSLDVSKCVTSAHIYYQSKYWKYRNINEYIPILKHYEMCKNIKDIMLPFIDSEKENTKHYSEYTSLIKNFSLIEKNGLHINSNIFDETFKGGNLYNVYDNKIFTEYNIYTTTGRPSNRHGGINFAALNKDDDTRSIFTSRYKNGKLIEFDFDAYHLRLIADIIGYEFPNSSVHKYLAKQYFKKDNISKDEYKQSKEMSFRVLYGGVPDNLSGIEYFNMIRKFINILWNDYKANGYIETPIFNRRLYSKNYEDLNKNKLFNYYVQAAETENNSKVITKLLDLQKTNNIKLVLSTYDSFLFDCEDINENLLDNIKSCFNHPVSINYGKTYQDMKNFTSEVVS